MSIRSNTLLMGRDLSPELQDILRRNGMQAHIVRQGDGFALAVQGHDSPLLTYPINQQQMRAMVDWGTNSANKKAYNTFAGILSNDFYLPKDFVHARNANGRVAMGLHGYRIGVGEYGRLPWDRRGLHPMMDPYHGRFLGWTPRQQEGWHMRRVGGALFMQGAPMVPDRPDGRMKPGELQNGAYGFYYKGQQTQVQQPQQDVLANLQTVIQPVEVKPRPVEPAKPYNELITSKVYFTNEKFRECLDSHGIVIDPEKKTLTIQSTGAKQDFVYDLTDEELKKLNSKDHIAITLKPEVAAELDQKQSLLLEQTNVQGVQQPLDPSLSVQREPEDKAVAHVDGQSLYDINEGKGWYREGRHGREVTVDDIKVEPVRNEQGEQQKDAKGNNLYRMTAVINGESISHEITQKQYDKFMAIDDYHRMKLFSHIFNEVDMKNVPGANVGIGAQIGGALLAGLAVMGELGHMHHSGPSVFVEHHHDHDPRPHIYFKPGVDSPQDIASRAFDAGVNAGMHGVGLGR